MKPAGDTIAAVATPPGRGGIGVVRVAGPSVPTVIAGVIGRELAPRHATLAVFRGEAGEPLDAGLALYFPGAALLHGRADARAARPWRPGGAASCARALPRARRAARRARGIHRARVPERQARPRAGRGRRRPDRRGDRNGGSRRRAKPRRRVLARGTRAHRRAGRAPDVHRGDARLSRRGDRLPARLRRAGQARGDPRAPRAGERARAPGGAAPRRADCRPGRRAERRQVEPAESSRRGRRRDRHADSRHDA